MCRRGKQARCDDGGLAVCRGEWRGGDVEEVVRWRSKGGVDWGFLLKREEWIFGWWAGLWFGPANEVGLGFIFGLGWE